MLLAFIAIATVCALVVYVASNADYPKDFFSNTNDDNHTSSTIDESLPWHQYWILLLAEYGMPFVHRFTSILWSLDGDSYFQMIFLNVTSFIIKYVPSGYCTFKSLRCFYHSSQDRIRRILTEVEDLQLQVHIVQEKLGVRESAVLEVAGQVRRQSARLHDVRTRVRRMLAADDELRQALGEAVPCCDPECLDTLKDNDEEPESIMSLLEEMKKTDLPEALTESGDMESFRPAQVDSSPSVEDSVYSSLDDGDVDQECRVKIVKVTKLYKVAYLRQYIKQKKIRRATQQALLKKKIETIKKLLESWQKSLNMVINSKLLLDSSRTLDAVSEDAMGDYSKCNVRESNSDTDLIKNNVICFDKYGLGWGQNIYRKYNNLPYNYEVEDCVTDAMVSKESRDEVEFEYSDYPTDLPGVCECSPPSNMLFILPEETSSQMAIAIQDSVKEEAIEHESECRDRLAI